METSLNRERLILMVAAAVAVGVHAGLAPEELEDWAPLGACFVAAAVALGGGVAVLALGRRYCDWAIIGLALLLVGLVVGYAATRLVALPPLDPDREALDPLGVVATAVEAAGVVAALRLARKHPASTIPGGKQ